ncbi:MAG: hypothetical protein WCO84_04085 [bacterium]
MRDRIRKNLKISIIVIITIAILTYACFEANSLIRGPSIDIDYPTSNLSLHDDTINISGKARNIHQFLLNGRPVFVSSTGDFSEKVILLKGYNSIFMEAKDRLGAKTQKLLEYVIDDSTNASTSEKIAKTESKILGI